jgi:F0F1-type ATP synthase assembly protein I
MAPTQKDEHGPDGFGMSLNFAVAILFFGALGWFVDGWVKTLPLFTIVGTLLGGVLGFLNVYWKIRRGDKDRGGAP